MKKSIWCFVLPVVFGLAIFVLGCSDSDSPPAPDQQVLNPYQKEAEAHNAVCESVLKRLEENAAGIKSMDDLNALFSSSFKEAFAANGLAVDYATAVAFAKEVMASHMEPDLAGDGLPKGEAGLDWLTGRLRTGYTPREVEMFLAVREKMLHRLTADEYASVVSQAERELRKVPSGSSDAMMRAFAVARASYRFWHDKGPFHLKRLRGLDLTKSDAGEAIADSASDLNTDGAALADLEAMAASAVTGTGPWVAAGATAVTSTIQFVYDNRGSIWDVVKEPVIWQLWLQGSFGPY
jgi:hypothetical protein